MRFEDLRLDVDGCLYQTRTAERRERHTCVVFFDDIDRELPHVIYFLPAPPTRANKRARRRPRRRDALPRRAASARAEVVCKHLAIDALRDGDGARATVPHRRDDQRLPDDPLKAPPQTPHPARPPPLHPPRPHRVPLPVLHPSLVPLPTRHPAPKL